MDRAWDWGGWGNVPADGDVIPFTRISPVRGDEPRHNKRHHFLPVTYMKGFCEGGRLWTFRAEAPETPLHVPPTSVGFERYYYSQKLDTGEQDNHRFEDFWNGVETVWATTVQAVRKGRLSPAISFNLLGMATTLRARVPAARDRNALLLATRLREEAKTADEMGILPPEFRIYAKQLDRVPVAANPQRTLATMFPEFKEFGDLCFEIGFEIVHNVSPIPFIASDNPVCIYDPTNATHLRRPYEHGDAVELLFPLDSRTLLRGSPRLKPVNSVGRHVRMSSKLAVRRVNRTIAQFGYRFLIAPDRSSDDLALRYSASAPTIEIDVERLEKEIRIVWRHCFGPRRRLSQFIDTPEKAARLQATMTAEGFPDGLEAFSDEDPVDGGLA